MTITEGRALARAALAGNPSDGYGGAVLAVPVPGLEATVRAEGAPALVADNLLLEASGRRLAAWLEETGAAPPGDPPGVALRSETSIPESVGLAGSSALVVAALRAMAGRWALRLDTETLARLALEVEVEVLGMAAGPQDRLVQAAGRAVLMDFAGDGWAVTPVDPPAPLELFVAWSLAGAAPSYEVHGPLGARRDEPDVVAAMTRLGDLARAGAAALAAGDGFGLGAAMDGSFEQRAAIVDLDPAHVALVHGARSTGAAVNYAGSGGAVVGFPERSAGIEKAAAWAAGAGHGFHRFTVPAG